MLTENRNGLILGVAATQATGTAERDAALQMIDAARARPIRISTAGMGKGYDSGPFLQEHVPLNALEPPPPAE